jgi:hypothetical protein
MLIRAQLYRQVELLKGFQYLNFEGKPRICVIHRVSA